MPLFIFI